MSKQADSLRVIKGGKRPYSLARAEKMRGWLKKVTNMVKKVNMVMNKVIKPRC